MKVLLSPDAETDLVEAISYIARDNPAAATRALERYLQAVERLASGFADGPEVVLVDGSEVRYWSLAPYRIYYRRLPEAVEILRFYHQARRPIER